MKDEISHQINSVSIVSSDKDPRHFLYFASSRTRARRFSRSFCKVQAAITLYSGYTKPFSLYIFDMRAVVMTAAFAMTTFGTHYTTSTPRNHISSTLYSRVNAYRLVVLL